jgi:hypothetical protein
MFQPMRRKFLRAVLFGSYLLTISVVLLEGGVRLWGYSEGHIYDPIYMPFDRTTEIAYVHKPNLTQARARGLAMINTDSLGLRAQTAGLRYGPKDKNEYRIAIAGDSVTFGEGIQDTEDTFSRVVEKILNKKQMDMKVRVFNYGASAYSVQQMSATLQYRMLDIQPDLVVMAIIPADFNLARTPAVDGAGYFVDTRLARLNPPEPAIKRALRGMRLTYVLRDAVYSWFVPIPEVVRNLARGVLPESYRYVQQFEAIAGKGGVPSIIVLLPTARADPFDRISTQLHHDEIAFVDLSSLRNEFTLEQFRSSRFDGHASAAVHQRIGQDLAEYILQSRLKNAVQTQAK